MIELAGAPELLTIGSALALAGVSGGFWARGRLKSSDETTYHSFIQNINEGYYRSTLDGKQLFANNALVRLNGYDDMDEMLASVDDIAEEWYVDPKRREAFQTLLDRDGYVENFISEIYRHKSRERIWISENARLVSDKQGRPLYYEGTVREFTDTKRRLELEELHDRLTREVPGVLVQARWGAANTFSVPYFSDGFKALIGNVSDDICKDAKGLFKLLHPEDFASFVASAEKSAKSLAPWRQQFRLLRENGQYFWCELHASPEIEEDGSCLWHGFMMDVSEKVEAQNRVHDLAFFDTLTGLPNRRRVQELLDDAFFAWRQDRYYGALMFIDLDNFKTLNDIRGHGQGDQLLLEISRRLEETAGPRGVVGRFGGDEFVVIFENLGRDKVKANERTEKLACALLTAVDQPCSLQSGDFHPSCSIGVVPSTSEAKNVEEVLKFADMAMHTAKHHGKNRVCHHRREMLEKLEADVALMNDLRLAVDQGQLSLHYQMQVDAEGIIEGAEGLLRWDHPTKGVVPPGEFIKAAEDCGLIIPITNWILSEAVKTLSSWQNDPQLRTIRLSINISAQQFHDQSFAPGVKARLKEFDVPADRLQLEMTEHVLVGDSRRVKAVMEELKAVGIRFSLDDFGTGYSSLIQLRELPFDEVKIDGTFVRDLEANESDRTIVNAILCMAKALGMTTVAEWVETIPQRDFLVKNGCDLFQGYLMGAAMPRGAFEEAARLPLFNAQASGPRFADIPNTEQGPRHAQASIS